MRRIRVNGELHALPFEKLFRAHTSDEASALRSSIEQFWIQSPVIVYNSPTHGQSIIDGGNRCELSGEIDSGRTVPVDDRGDMTDLAAEALAMTLNLDRRQLTLEEIAAFRERQAKQAKQLRAAGFSYRTIAEKTGLSIGTLHREISGVPLGTPDEDDGDDGDLPGVWHGLEMQAQINGDHDAAEEYREKRVRDETRRVTGRDGKSYLATRAPVVVAKTPVDFERNAAVAEVARTKRFATSLCESLTELFAGPLAGKLKRELTGAGFPGSAAKWNGLIDALGRVD